MYKIQNMHKNMHNTKTKSGLYMLKTGINSRFFAFFAIFSKNLNKYSFRG